MSMTHSTHLIDWKLYSSKINGPSRNPEKPKEWQTAIEAVGALASPKELARMPDWKQELITNQFEDVESLLQPQKKATLENIRDLHFLGILCCCVKEGEGYDQQWDLVKECLRKELGNEVGDDLVLGRYWKGSAWEFAPELLSYQFGILEGQWMKECRRKVNTITEKRLVATLESIDLKENYPCYGAPLEPDDIKWVVEAFKKLNRNLKRADESGLAILYMLD